MDFSAPAAWISIPQGATGPVARSSTAMQRDSSCAVGRTPARRRLKPRRFARACSQDSAPIAPASRATRCAAPFDCASAAYHMPKTIAASASVWRFQRTRVFIPSRQRRLGDQLPGEIHSRGAIQRMVQAVAHDRNRHGLKILRQHHRAAIQKRPGACRS